MTRPHVKKLENAAVEAWLAKNASWAIEDNGLVRTFKTADFSASLAGAVRLGMVAEKRDHHPDITIGWGKAKVFWTTHDAGGITTLDLELAEATNTMFG